LTKFCIVSVFVFRHRGKLVSYNQALPHNANATVELIDCGTNYLTSFDNLKALNIFKDNPYVSKIFDILKTFFTYSIYFILGFTN